MELRPYQTELINKARAEMNRGSRRVLIVAPCGAGKTVLAMFMCAEHVKRGGSVLFLAHRNELLEQTRDTLTRADVPQTGIAIMSVQTLSSRLRRGQPGPPATLIIMDECHHCRSEQYRSVLSAYPDAWLIGLTATPCRLDGKGLGEVFDDMAQGVTTAELIQSHYLAPYKYYSMPLLDAGRLKTTRGDYDRKQLNALYSANERKIVGDVIEHYRRLTPGKQAIVYCTSVEASRRLCERFTAEGIPQAHIWMAKRLRTSVNGWCGHSEAVSYAC